MIADISLEAVTGKLNKDRLPGLHAGAAACQEPSGNRNLELAHWLFHIASAGGDRRRVDRSTITSSIARSLVSDIAIGRGWQFRKKTKPRCRASPIRGDRRSRSRLALCHPVLRRDADPHRPSSRQRDEDRRKCAGRFDRVCRRNSRKLPVEELATGHRTLWATSVEENLQPLDGSGIQAAGTGLGCRHSGQKRHDRARPVFAGPHRQGRRGHHGSDPRPRRGDPPDHRRPDAPAPEQSDPDRRGGRRQDGRRRRVSRKRSRPDDVPPCLAGRAALRARHRPDAGRRLDEG